MAKQQLLPHAEIKLNRVINEGELFIKSNNEEFKKHRVVLIKPYLHCYRALKQHQENEDKIDIDLRSYNSVESDGRRSKQFYLKNKLGQKPFIFKALSTEDKEEWIQYLRELNLLPDKYGKTVKWENKFESAFCFIFVFFCVAMMIIFGIDAAANNVNHDTWIHAFCLPLSSYQVTLIILCSCYCLSYEQPINKLKQLMKFNKFWAQSVLCSIYNLMAFLLLSIHLFMQLYQNKLSADNAWFFANAMVYFLGIFSIPFPAICIRLHHKFKYQEKTEPNSKGNLSGSVSLASAAGSAETSITEQFRSWLEDDVKLGEYYGVFKEAKLDDLSIIAQVTDSHLESLDIAIGDRIRIKNHIEEMKNKRLRKFSISSAKASVAGSKPIFRDAMIKGAICTCYVIHFLSYVSNPLLNHSSYSSMLNIMYPGYDTGKNIFYNVNTMIYVGNQIFLRTFVGMSLTSVFFTFVTELTDKSIISTSYRYLWRMWKDQQNTIWIFIVIMMTFLWSFEIFAFRELIDDNMNTDNFNMNIFINGLWIFINLAVTLWNVYLFDLFSGIYQKTKHKHEHRYSYKIKSPESPIKAFVLELILLNSLYLVYIIFLIVYISGDDTQYIQWDIYRQSSILVLVFSQFATLIRVKQSQKYPDSLYIDRFNKRSSLLLHGYFKLNCLLLVYHTSYIFIFKIQYFGSKVFDSSHLYQNIGYAFSFSLSASILFSLSHLINSYKKWNIDVSRSRAVSHDTCSIISGQNVNRNPGLNDFMKQQQKRRTSTLDSLGVTGSING